MVRNIFPELRSANSRISTAGGMDLYVRQLGDIHQHDQFFVNETIITAFMNYTTQIVSRYVNSPSVFAWCVSRTLSTSGK